MFFLVGKICLEDSQTTCDLPPLFGRDVPKFIFLFSSRGGGAGDGLVGWN